MVRPVRNSLIVALLFTVALSLSGCDKVSDFLKNFSGGTQQEESKSVEPSYEKTQLLDILADQKELIEQMENAKSFGDRRLLMELSEKILRLDQSYQEKYNSYEAKLSSSDCLEISRKHSEIMSNLPRLGA